MRNGSYTVPIAPGRADAGARLKTRREELGLTLREVAQRTAALAAERGDDRFSIPHTRLLEFESNKSVPTLHRLASLACVYHLEVQDLAAWFVGAFPPSTELAPEAARTKLIREFLHDDGSILMPTSLEPHVGGAETLNLTRIVQEWGFVPLKYLAALARDGRYVYGFVGRNDWAMYPLIPPGSFLQIDQEQREVQAAAVRNERERPIYFLEHAQGYCIGWCHVAGRQLQVQPHPSSPVLEIKCYRLPDEVEVVGRVVGVAMSLRCEPQNGHGVVTPQRR